MSRSTALAILAAVGVLAAGLLVVAGGPPPALPADPTAEDGPDFETFESTDDYREYVRQGRQLAADGVVWTGGSDGLVDLAGGREVATTTEAMRSDAAGNAAGAPAGAADPRVSGTNVQEAGIDEPDVVKTDGEYVYYGGGPREFREKFGDVDVLGVRPPGTADPVAEIDASGRLLRTGDALVVFGRDGLRGYDVSDPTDPAEAWSRSLNSSVVSARLHDGTVYLVLARGGSAATGCPFAPLDGEVVHCTDVYHPDRPLPVDATYTALALDPATGEVGDRVSFVGSRRAVVYVSEGGVYVTYTESTRRTEVALDFLLSEGRDVLDDDTVAHLEQLDEYDISAGAKWTEIRTVMREEQIEMTEAEREAFRETLTERYGDYARSNRGRFTTTHVVKLAVDDGLAVAATGSVPGAPLNQFSLDEHEGHLRVATTLDPPDLWGEATSVNDVYVLDGDLSVAGSVTGMGENERVYSVRFVGDTGYVVTFRRIDPFHVLDLSEPANPILEGELKLPGFSTYMHPLGDGRVLGIGEEDRQVKAVVFDASEPTDPRIEDSVVLGDRWSAVRQSHHAFLLDPRHEVFFLPAEGGGHVFSYADGLQKVTTVDVADPRRAVYVGDYLYVFGRAELVVVDETTWEPVERVELD